MIRKGIIKLSDIEFNSAIYPRHEGKWNTKTIEHYAGVMMTGKQFPPLILEEGTNILLDGVHRWKAYQKYNEDIKLLKNGDALSAITEIEVEWHDIPDEKLPEDTKRKLYAGELSQGHGDRLDSAARRDLAREVFSGNPDYDIKRLMSKINMSKATLYEYVKDILAKRDEEKKATALRLSRLGWSQEEIAGVIGATQQTTSNFLQKFPELEKMVKNLLASGLNHEDIADRYRIPVQVVWGIDLQGTSNDEKFKKLKITRRAADALATYSTCHNLFGSEHPGRIPGQIVVETLANYTKEGDVVIDPMAGSGTTADVCLAMNRKCYSYDIDMRHERPDIIEHNIVDEGWPERIKKADLIFWDAPYFDKMDSSRIGPEGYIDGSISKLSREDYLNFFKITCADALSKVKKGTKLAFLMAPYDDPDDESRNIYINDYVNLIIAAGWRIKREISANLPTQQVHPDIYNKQCANDRMSRLIRQLTIFER